jgi:patatin-like phospholipase/acyl hydrolase
MYEQLLFSFNLTLTKTYRGGIRGIIELEVLFEIERGIGGKIPIQDFFDLIVGTR